MNPITSLRTQPPSRPTLLLVEDDFPTRWTAAEFFRAAGYTVIEAVDVAEALAVLLTGKLIDAVFSDVNLPDDPGGGTFLSDWLAKHRPNVPVLLTSGNKTHATVLVQHKPLRQFVIKPYDLDEVARLLRAMLTGGMSMP
jgi:DNA-binding NtrC family response regulator